MTLAAPYVFPRSLDNSMFGEHCHSYSGDQRDYGQGIDRLPDRQQLDSGTTAYGNYVSRQLLST
jgi:hypothetical protein